MVEYRWVSCDSIINQIVGEDRLFFGNYTLDPYQKCDIGCIYCDASDEVVYIKSNAIEILEREIERIGNGTVIIGSTVDPYQMIEKEQRLTQRVIDILVKQGIKFHILTKSDLVLRDLPLFRKYKNAGITISISTLNKTYAKTLEPNAPSPKKRLETIKKLSENGVNVGVAIMPVLPLITEVEIDEIIRLSKKAGARYLIYEYLELKGDYKEKFLSFVRKFIPQHFELYERLYENNYKPENYNIEKKIEVYCKKHNMRIGFRDANEG